MQIWIAPSTKDAEPRYQQKHFSADDKRGTLRLIISPDGANDSLEVRQDARVYAGLFDGEETARLELPADRFAYVHVARGSVAVNGTRLTEGDGARVRHETALTFADGDNAEVLVFDLRPIEVSSLWS